MANRYLAGIDMNGNIINNARLEQQNSNVNYDNNLHPAGQIVYNPSLQRAVMTTPTSNNNYTNQLAYLSDIAGGSELDYGAFVYFVNYNFVSGVANNCYKDISEVMPIIEDKNKQGVIVLYEGQYMIDRATFKNIDDIAFLAIGKVEVYTTEDIIGWTLNSLKMYGDITLNLGGNFELTNTNVTLDITEVKSTEVDGNNVPTSKIIFNSGNTNIKLLYMNVKLQYIPSSSIHSWNILHVGRIGSQNVVIPSIEFQGGNVTYTHFRLKADYNFGTYSTINAIDDGMVSQQVTKYYDITSNTIYGGQQFAFSQPLAPLGINVNNIQELTPYYVNNNQPRMYGGRNLRAYILNGNLEVQVLDYQGSAIETVPIGEQALLGAIIRTLE